jgi:hypothetical protein
MIKTFTGITLLALAIMYIYSQGNGFDHKPEKGILPKFTTGNMGSADALCHNILLDQTHLIINLECATGTMQNIKYFGIIPKVENTTSVDLHNIKTKKKIYNNYCGESSNINVKCRSEIID